jgi:hypothetical protein
VAGAPALPEYPEDELKRRDGGRIPVQLVFMAPDRAPLVRLLGDQGLQALVRSVQAYAKDFRVPCMAPGAEPVRLDQEYVFVPNDGRKVMYSRPVDAADRQRRTQIACMTRITGPERPRYPAQALTLGDQGNVYARLRFTSPTEPPSVTVLARSGHRAFWREVEAFAADYRVPCLAGEAVDIAMLYTFRIEGGARTRLNDLTLRDWLVAVSAPPLPAYFDTTTMGCPFDVRLQYLRPHEPNIVLEVESANPARRQFLDWLAAMKLELDPGVNTAVLGDTITISVPCAKIDL